MTKNQIINNNDSESSLQKQKLTSIALRIIGAILLFLALSKMPYGYYTFLRWSIMIL